jgi:hypothetical protein
VFKHILRISFVFVAVGIFLLLPSSSKTFISLDIMCARHISVLFDVIKKPSDILLLCELQNLRIVGVNNIQIYDETFKS